MSAILSRPQWVKTNIVSKLQYFQRNIHAAHALLYLLWLDIV